jgi:hypothetical protein
MRHVTLLLVLLIITCCSLQAQITIGSAKKPDGNALLDINEAKGTGENLSEKGLLLPRVELTDAHLAAPMAQHVAGMIVYNTASSLTDGSVDAMDYVSPGFYYNDGNRWQKLSLGTTNWFYMPSIAIDVTASGNFTRDLYLEYLKQFTDTENSITSTESPVVGTPLISSLSGSNPSPFTTIFAADQLDYYVTGYDATVFSGLSISADGKLNYTVNPNNVTGATYMNIVFVKKAIY